MFARIQLYAAACAAFAISLLAVFFAGSTRGKDKLRRDLDEHALDVMRTSKETKNEIDDLDDTELSSRARSWVRKDNG